MSIWRLVFREIVFRKLNFGLAVVSAASTVACLAVVVTLLHQYDLVTLETIRAHDLVTLELMNRYDKATDESMRRHEDDMRKTTLKLGFNVLILPKDQNLADLYADDFASKYMPDGYAQKLVRANVATIRHLLPNLQERLFWKERQRTVLLFGTRGEVDKRDKKKPLLDTVPQGRVVLGYELHHGSGLKKGDSLALSFSRQKGGSPEDLQTVTYTIHDLRGQHGNKDDITLFVNLADAQSILKKPGRINSLLALECDCGAQRLAHVREEIAKILPDTQVIEYHSQALARAETRNQATAKRAELREQTAAHRAESRSQTAVHRETLRQQQEDFAAWLVPLVVLGCTVLLGVLAFINVQDRVTEIGILRALGVSSLQVFGLFLTKSVLAGLLGAIVGYGLGTATGALVGEMPAEMDVISLFANPWLIGLVCAAAPLWCALASLLPALRAARQDPAIVLQQE